MTTPAIAEQHHDTHDILGLTTAIVSAHLSTKETDAAEIPNLIKMIHDTLKGLAAGGARLPQMTAAAPAVPIEESVQPDYIVCLEDGRQLQVLKRHLKTAFGMSIDEYKKRWGLPADYPTVAPNYSKRRSNIAKDTGLGNTPKKRKSSLKSAA
jgi:predicted transcriptional regulator